MRRVCLALCLLPLNNDKNDNTIAIKTAMTDNSKSHSHNANPKIRNSDYVNWGDYRKAYTGVIEMVKLRKKEVNQVSSKLINLIVVRNYGGYQTDMVF